MASHPGKNARDLVFFAALCLVIAVTVAVGSACLLAYSATR